MHSMFIYIPNSHKKKACMDAFTGLPRILMLHPDRHTCRAHSMDHVICTCLLSVSFPYLRSMRCFVIFFVLLLYFIHITNNTTVKTTTVSFMESHSTE